MNGGKGLALAAYRKTWATLRERKKFFFKKKNQKTFATLGCA
jgi:hypothetical protein